MNGEIKNIKLNFACNENWDGMKADGAGKHCDKCQKKVYDFTDAKQQEFLQILAENDHNICGRFSAAQMAPPTIYIPAWKKWVSAALVLIGINLFNHKAEAQKGKVKITNQAKPIETDAVLGLYLPMNMPEFPGGQQALMSFLAKNIKYQKGGIDGKVFVRFLVKKDGVLSNIEIIRGAGKINNNEVIRVLKLSPKWKPCINNGKATECSYTLPVSFERKK